MNGQPVAAIDCGTNSTRLLIAGPDGRTIDRRMTITRLGYGVDRTRRLDPAAIERTTAVLTNYRDAMDAAGVDKVRITATSAARDATNREDFFRPAEEIIGVRPELLSGDQEARLSFAGATASLDPAGGPYLVVDIGGGSTEFAVGPDPQGDPLSPTGAVSVDIGCVRLTERFLHHDPPRPEELAQALSVVEDYLDDVRRDVPGAMDAARLVGLAGTVTTIAAVEIGLATYDRDRIHHFVLTHQAVEEVFRTLATEKRADRVFNPGLDPARADVIVAGCIILVAVMRRFGFEECLVSEEDILDGLARSLLVAAGQPKPA
ncbi:MAG TPA: Ppx/GppA phosphatase family protein [Acidimicrobiales bacterium]|nr:Ppx/GppA phosphatase family protein [Acidimicrobiales bacterium]